MINSREFLRKIVSAAGISGFEDPVREIVREQWVELTDEISVSTLGSLHALKKGTQSGAERRKIMISTHMDAIGFMVTKVQGDFIRFTSVGGWDPRVLPYQFIRIHGKEPVDGIIALPLDRHLPDDIKGKAVPLNQLFIDTGRSAEELKKLVKPGDPISLRNLPVEVDDETIAAHTLDDRASVAALDHCLQILQSRIHKWDVVAVASVQEEVGLKGAMTSGYQENPDLAIAMDVGFASEPGGSGYYMLELGKGPAIAWGPVLNMKLTQKIIDVADKFNIPYSKEINPDGRTGTDTDGINLTREGIPTALFSIPLRFMHSPHEIMRYEDIEASGRLLAEFICTLDEKVMEEFTEHIPCGKEAV
jgi:putative aminopeptidase FrvX